MRGSSLLGRMAATLWMALAIAAAPRQLDVVVPGDGGAPLAGTLTLPTTDGRVPAVVLLAGSGPTDRDGNQPPTIRSDLLRTLADRLARAGVASVRYDKRGMYANRADQPKTVAALTKYYAWTPFVNDARAAVAFLRARPDVDPDRVGLAGHSEGGLLALCAAAELAQGGRPARALVLLATPGRPVDVVLADQLSARMRQQWVPPAVAQAILAANADVTRSLRTTGHRPAAGVPLPLAALYPPYLDDFWHGELAVDPPALATAFAGPVLVAQGTADAQVSADRDAAALDAALARRAHDDHKLIRIGGASHFLKPTTGPTADGVGGDVPPAALDAIVAWTAGHL